MTEDEFGKKITKGFVKLAKATKKATLALATLGIVLDRLEGTEEWYNSLTPIEKIMRYLRNVIKYYPLNCPDTRKDT